MVCEDCDKELGLLRAYERWLACGEDGMPGGEDGFGRESLFPWTLIRNETEYS